MEAESAAAAIIEQAHLDDENLDMSTALTELGHAIEAVSVRKVRVSAELAKKKVQLQKLISANASLDAAREAIVLQEAELKNITEKAVVERQKAVDLLSSIVSLEAITEAATTMAKCHNPRFSNNRGQFAAAQKVIDAARDRLRKAGLGSMALNYLAGMNFNRPDRDNVARAGDVVEGIYAIIDVKEEA